MHSLEWVLIDPPYKSVLYKERGKHATHFDPLYEGTTYLWGGMVTGIKFEQHVSKSKGGSPIIVNIRTYRENEDRYITMCRMLNIINKNSFIPTL